MKRNLVFITLLAILSVLLAVPTVAQTATVKGVCKDAQGNPIADAQVVWHNNDNGRTFNLKTNKKGEYFSLGIEPGKYTVTVSKDGKELDKVNNYPVSSDEMNLDFDLKKSQEQAVQDTAKQKGMTPEQVKQMQQAQANAEKYNTNIKAANEKLKAASAQLDTANTALKSGDTATANTNYDSAIATLNETSQLVPNEDYVWYRLGSAYLASAKSQSDATEKAKRNTEAFTDLQKAIDLKKEAMKNPPQGGAPKAPAPGGLSDNARLAAYYDSLAQAAARNGKSEDAANAYRQAAELDPSHADGYYFNLGAILTNSNTTGDAAMRKQAIEAFDKAIAANPNNAEAYYQKGQALIGMATMQSDKLVAPEGTAEAFKKYLELKPDGPNAQAAKDTLALIGSSVQTSYGTKKKKN
jgi:tetratricopeptide (TPR) repeat protein